MIYACLFKYGCQVWLRLPNFPANVLVNLSKSQNTPCLTVFKMRHMSAWEEKNNINPL